MYMVNIQLLSDRDYAKALPEGYVINVKATEMKKAVIQIAKRLETDRSKVYHMNTDKFEETHKDAVSGVVKYNTDPTTNHIDLVAAVSPAVGLTDTLTELTGRMLHRTQTLAGKLEAEDRKASRSKSTQTEAEATAEE